MKKRLLSVFAALCLTLSSVCFASCGTEREFYSIESLEFFDTVTTVTGYADSREEFDEVAGEILQMLAEYHRLFDIYNSYEGIKNLHAVNSQAATCPIKVDARIMDLLLYGKEMHELTEGSVNIAMGSILSLWHACREQAKKAPENATIPDTDALAEARNHVDINALLLDEAAGTVFFSDPLLRLDVGAVAKGYAVEQVAKALEKQGISGYVMNVGGNVRALGEKADGSPWTVGVEHPEAGKDYLARLSLCGESLVTSGSYQRYYTVGGVRYHHIIDPDTGMPAKGFSSVSVVCPSSALADALSTALFCMSLEEGRSLIESLSDTEALWLHEDRTVTVSSSFEKYSLP